MASSKKTLSLEITPEILEELTAIVRHIGIASPEVLVKNYLREVVIAARIEQATAQTRITVIKRSDDLNILKIEAK